jgi:hypothetical protein
MHGAQLQHHCWKHVTMPLVFSWGAVCQDILTASLLVHFFLHVFQPGAALSTIYIGYVLDPFPWHAM